MQIHGSYCHWYPHYNAQNIQQAHKKFVSVKRIVRLHRVHGQSTHAWRLETIFSLFLHLFCMGNSYSLMINH